MPIQIISPRKRVNQISYYLCFPGLMFPCDADGEPVGWALIIPSLDADESVADFSDNELMNDLAGC